ncbi:hypothetical protein Q9L58_010193, partial [Maublancomyces gigas]
LANDRELKHNVLASQLLVHLAESIDLVIDGRALLGVQEDLDDLMSVLLGADPLAYDLSGVDKVREDRIMDGSERARSRALLGDAAAARGEREDTALGDKQDVAVGEFLLELTRESSLRNLFVSGLKSVYFWENGGGDEMYLCWTLRKPPKRGTGTKTTIAFLPWPTSSWRSGPGS